MSETPAWHVHRLATYKCPRVVHFVDQLPRNAMGKAMEAELARRVPSPPE